MLLKYNPKDERHRGEYKNSNSVQAFDADGNSLGIVFETTSAFDTPRQTQGTLNSERQPNWEPWLLFFLRVLQRQKNRLQTKIDNERMMASTLPLLSVRILELAKEHGRVTTQSIEQATGESRSTIKSTQTTHDRSTHDSLWQWQIYLVWAGLNVRSIINIFIMKINFESHTNL